MEPALFNVAKQDESTRVIDKDTNLPWLPDGYFWKIRRDSEGELVIELRKHVSYKLFWSGKTRWKTKKLGAWYPSALDKIVVSCHRVLDNFYWDVYEKDLMGDYSKSSGKKLRKPVK